MTSFTCVFVYLPLFLHKLLAAAHQRLSHVPCKLIK